MNNKERIDFLKESLKEAEEKLNNNLCKSDKIVNSLKRRVDIERDALRESLKKKC